MQFTEWPLEFATFTKSKIGINAYMELKSLALESSRVDWVAELERLKELEAA